MKRILTYAILAALLTMSWPPVDVDAQLIPGRLGGAFQIPWLAPTTPTDCSAPQYSFQGDADTGYSRSGPNSLYFCANGIGYAVLDTAQFQLASSHTLNWGGDTVLARDAANVLAQRNGTSAQAFRLYNTYSAAGANYERVALEYSSNTAFLMAEHAGTGLARHFEVGTRGSGASLVFRTGNTQRFYFDGTTGHFVAATDNTYDIGLSSGNRPRQIYASGYLAAPRVYWSSGASSSVSLAPANGQLNLLNNAETAGIGLDFSSDGVLTIRNRAQAANAALRSSSFGATGSFITSGSGTGITVSNDGLVARHVYKVVIDETAFVCAATTCDVNIGTMPAGTALLSAYARLTTTFACSATCTTSTLSLQLGGTAGGTEYLASMDADAATATFGDTDAEMGTQLARAAAVQGGALVSFAGAQGVNFRLTSGTGNIGNGSTNNLSQGSITVYLVTERLP